MINLLPPEIKQERMYGRRNRILLGYSILLLLTALITASIMVGSLQFVGSDESNIRAEIETGNENIVVLEGNIQSIESIAKRLETAKTLSDLSVEFSDLIPKIGAVLPEGVILNSLTLTGGVTDPLQLDVDLLNADLAPVLVSNLVASELFEAADITSLTPVGTSDGEESGTVYTFSASLTASFTGSAEAKQKAKAAAAAAAEAEAAAAEAAAGGGQ